LRINNVLGRSKNKKKKEREKQRMVATENPSALPAGINSLGYFSPLLEVVSGNVIKSVT